MPSPKRPRCPARAPRRGPLTPALLLAALVGCSSKAAATLEGDWSGSADCGEGSVSVSMSLSESNPQSYVGTGEVLNLSYGGLEATVSMELSVEQPEAEGAQTVALEADCLIANDEGAEVVDCSGFSELGWDGADTLGAAVTDFMSSGLDCDLELRR